MSDDGFVKATSDIVAKLVEKLPTKSAFAFNLLADGIAAYFALKIIPSFTSAPLTEEHLFFLLTLVVILPFAFAALCLWGAILVWQIQRN